MPMYRVPVVIKGYALLRYPDGKGAGDYTGGLPRDAEAEVRATTPFLGGSRMVDFTVEVSGEAQRIERN
jgi:hypothetical protein